MTRVEAVKAAVRTFCRLNGIDPDCEQAQEFYCVMLSEVCGAAAGTPGAGEQYAAEHGQGLS